MERILFSKIHRSPEMNEIENREKEFYSKLQVAGSIKFVAGEESDKVWRSRS
jgi:hypothetical protein